MYSKATLAVIFIALDAEVPGVPVQTHYLLAYYVYTEMNVSQYYFVLCVSIDFICRVPSSCHINKQE